MAAKHASSQADSNASIDVNAFNASIAVMATLTIRNLPDSVRDALRVRAAQNGRSMEAEAREALVNSIAASAQPDGYMARIRDMQKRLAPYRKKGILASDELIAERRLEAVWEELDALGISDERRRG